MSTKKAKQYRKKIADEARKYNLNDDQIKLLYALNGIESRSGTATESMYYSWGSMLYSWGGHGREGLNPKSTFGKHAIKNGWLDEDGNIIGESVTVKYKRKGKTFTKVIPKGTNDYIRSLHTAKSQDANGHPLSKEEIKRRQRELFGLAYSDRNGNTGPEDAIKYIGRGGIQLTGRANYEKITKILNKRGIDIDLVANPELAADEKYSAAILLAYAESRGMFDPTSKRYISPEDIEKIKKGDADAIDKLHDITNPQAGNESLTAEVKTVFENENNEYDVMGSDQPPGTEWNPDLGTYVSPEVVIEEESQKKTDNKNKIKYNKEILDRISGRKEYLEFLEENQDLYKKLDNLEKNISSLSPGTKAHTDAVNKKAELERELNKKEADLRKRLHKAELNNYINAENNAREELSMLENEVKGYLDAGEEVPTELAERINKAREQVKINGNRVKKLNQEGPENYDISPIQKGYNQNILLPDGSINKEASEATPILKNPLDDKEKGAINIVDEKTDTDLVPEEDKDLIPKIETVPLTEIPVEIDDQIITADPIEVDENAVVEIIDEEKDELQDPEKKGLSLKKPKINLQKLGGVGANLLRGVGAAMDQIGGPGAIISYIMGKKGLKAAMKEIVPQASAQLSPDFMAHLRETKELSKKGFHPVEEMKFRKELDTAYQVALEKKIRGTGGDRAKFLAQSGILDAQRSSALLDYAVKDAELQRKNRDKYEKMMLFKENFDIQRTEKERLEDMNRQIADKQAAADFTSAALTNAMSGLNKMNVSALVDSFLGNKKSDSIYNQMNLDQNTELQENK